MNEFTVVKQVFTKIDLAIFIPSGGGSASHKNRPSHGFAFNCSGEKDYTFDYSKQPSNALFKYKKAFIRN